MLLSNAVLTLCRTRLIDFFGINNIIILFAHKETHKLTWISPNQRDKKQIDHLLISGKWRKSLQDVRFRRGAHVGSDHHLVCVCVCVCVCVRACVRACVRVCVRGDRERERYRDRQ